MAAIAVPAAQQSSVMTRRALERVVREGVLGGVAGVNAQKGDFAFGSDPALDTRIITAASKAAGRSVPDCMLERLPTVSRLLDYLCLPMERPSVKGVPKFELFAGAELPPNVTLINYRKRKWTDQIYSDFLRRSLRAAGLLDSIEPTVPRQ